MKWFRNGGKSILRDERGHVGVIFALALVPVAVLSGGSVDYGRALTQRSKLQVAADAAALAAAQPVDMDAGERTEIAEKVFQANVGSSSLSGVAPAVTVVGDEVTVDAVTNVKTPFLNLIQIPELEIAAAAKVQGGETVSQDAPGRICLLALDPNSDDGIHLQGDNHVNYIDCWAHTNSSKPSAINANGSNATAVGKGHCAVGGATSTHTTFTPSPTVNCREVRDPFATVGAYSGGAYTPTFTPPSLAVTCKASNLNLKKGNFTLDPGRYCGGINIQAHANVTLNPGIYYIDNGELNVQSGSTMTGSNVLFYLAGAASKMTVIGGGTVDLKGRSTTASYAGFLVIAHPDANRMGESNIQGGGTFKLQGVIYMPTQRIEVSGNGDVNAADINVFGMVAKDFYFRGNGVFNTKKHNGSGTVPNIMPDMPVEGIRKTVLR